jgi:uncharacterized protein (UPF0332 family)
MFDYSKVKNKKLYKKVKKIAEQLVDLKHDLQYESESELTKNGIYKAIDGLRYFLDNVKLKGDING